MKIFKKLNKKISLLILIIIFGIFSLNISISEKPYECKNCNVIIISVTNLRQDHVGIYGYKRNTTPNIDNYFEDGIIFENAFSHASWTLPAGISLFTSLYPYTHGVMVRKDNVKLNRSILTLVDILKSKGYITAAFTGGFDYSKKYGLIDRFDISVVKINREGGLIKHHRYGSFEKTIPAAISWLKKNKNKKFFLFVQGFDVHCPFTPPPPYDKLFDPDYKGNVDYSTCLWTFDKTEAFKIGNKTYYTVKTYNISEKGEFYVFEVNLSERDIQHMIALYDGEIKYADKLIGKLLKYLKASGLEKNTIIILLSEHGDMFGKHGRFMRGGPLRGTLYDDVIHIPLLLKHPKLKSKKINELVQMIDVAPTLLDFLGIEKPKNFEGKSLIPLIMEGKKINDFVFAGAKYEPSPNNLFFHYSSRVEAIRNKKWKLIREILFYNSSYSQETYELYNLKKDPEELNNIYATSEYPRKIMELNLKLFLKRWNLK